MEEIPNLNPSLLTDRTARLIPLDRIDPDPDQPRKTFPEAPLRELADHIWLQGLIQPITATLAEEGRFKIFTGERRWRAFQVNRERAEKFWAAAPADVPEDHPAHRYERWTTIPLLESAPLPPADRLLLQVGENHDRSDLTLYERAAAIYRSLQLSGLKNKDFAEKTGISAPLLSTYKGLATSSGLTKLALENGVLQDHQAAKLYMQLPYDVQERLLGHAQEIEGTLTRPQLQRELDAIEAANELAKKAAAEEPPATTEGSPTAEATPGAVPAPGLGTPSKNDGDTTPEPSTVTLDPEGPVLSVEALLWLQNVLEGFDGGEDILLRTNAYEVLTKAILESSPFILIREVPVTALTVTEGAAYEEVTAA
jgi:ParB-like chromosome segregation protein Spo0J